MDGKTAAVRRVLSACVCNPYPGYDDVDGDPFLFEGEVDGRYTAMTRLVGVERDGAALAVPLTVLERDGVVSADLAGTSLVFFWQPGTASPLDTPTLLEGDEIGATGVFVASVDGQQLTFRRSAVWHDAVWLCNSSRRR